MFFTVLVVFFFFLIFSFGLRAFQMFSLTASEEMEVNPEWSEDPQEAFRVPGDVNVTGYYTTYSTCQ